MTAPDEQERDHWQEYKDDLAMGYIDRDGHQIDMAPDPDGAQLWDPVLAQRADAMTKYPTPPSWVLTCYDKPVGEYADLEAATTAGDVHIRTCPQGGMPWATDVKWHHTDLGSYCSAANGDWLNHHLHPKGDEGTVWTLAHNVRTRLPNGKIVLSQAGGNVDVRWWPDGRVDPPSLVVDDQAGDT